MLTCHWPTFVYFVDLDRNPDCHRLKKLWTDYGEAILRWLSTAMVCIVEIHKLEEFLQFFANVSGVVLSPLIGRTFGYQQVKSALNTSTGGTFWQQESS